MHREEDVAIRAVLSNGHLRATGESLPRLAPRAVVVAQDPEIRDDWGRSLEASGMHVARCAGPALTCILLRGAERCPLLDDAGIALYDESLLTEEFISRLRSSRHMAMVIATRDRCRIDGDHEPAMSRVVSPPTA